MSSDHAAPAARGHNPRLFKDGRSVLFDAAAGVTLAVIAAIVAL
jgi:hypothetical protein